MERYEYKQGTSNKFWEITVSGSSLTTTYGRIGSDGKSTTKDFASAAAAQTASEKLVAQKTKKGYVKVSSGKKGVTKKATGKATLAKKKAVKKETVKKKTAKKTVKKKEADPASAAADTGWQRYEYVAGSSKKFWEVQVDGESYSTRYGRIGADGSVTTKQADSAREALTLAKKGAAAKVKKGYKLVSGALGGVSTVAAFNPELEAALLEDPDDVEAYLVYADWLQAQGDPRGELIVLQHRQMKKPKDKKLAKQIDKLLEQHRTHFWGPIADYPDMLDGVEWFMGFIKSAKVFTNYERAPGFGDKDKVVAFDELLEDFLALPSARFLQHLRLGLQSPEANNYSGAARIIGRRRLLALRGLYIGDFHSEETELNWSDIGDLEPLYKGVPNLEELTLRSGHMTPGRIKLPKLRSFTTITGSIRSPALRQIAAAKWPELEVLSLQLGRELDGSPVKDLRSILSGKGLKKVTTLGLSNNKWADDVCAALPRAAILPQLKKLDLSKGTMSDVGVEHLVTNAAKFKHLEELDVSENYITAAGIRSLKGICKQVVFKAGKRSWRVSVLPSGQREDRGGPEDRYIAAYE